MLELLRPPPHRGPLIAAGAVALAVGLGLAELRIDDALTPGYHLFALAVAAALVLTLGLQAPNEEGRPPAYRSVLLVTGLALLYGALLRLADALGDGNGGFPNATVTLTALAEAAAALAIAVRTRSAVCAFLAAVAAMVGIVAGWGWAFDPDGFSARRWLLTLGAGGLVLGSLVLRERRSREAELLVSAAGLATLTIALQALLEGIGFLGVFGGDGLPGFWELVVLGAGFGLVAYGALERRPGPAWIGAANLAAFIAVAGFFSDDTLRWWPLVLILVGAVAMAAGLRPRKPLPPEPTAYRAGDAPLASRTEEVVLRVRVDDAPPRSAGGRK
ncbi:MAG TPA: hypothetical protein VHJ39_04920 [Solirubrobacteraceae bacterium]|nr:hypothetical protein [Solirubrobacteraceae bacterium]